MDPFLGQAHLASCGSSDNSKKKLDLEALRAHLGPMDADPKQVSDVLEALVVYISYFVVIYATHHTLSRQAASRTSDIDPQAARMILLKAGQAMRPASAGHK